MAEIKRTTWDSLSEVRAQKLASFPPFIVLFSSFPHPSCLKMSSQPPPRPSIHPLPHHPNSPKTLFSSSYCLGLLSWAQDFHSESLVWVKSLIHLLHTPLLHQLSLSSDLTKQNKTSPQN